MSVTSTRVVVIGLLGDITLNQEIDALVNGTSPGDVDILTLSAGANTITAPNGGSTPTGATIVPPAGNSQTLTLQGLAGDVGISIHPTDPTSLGLAVGVSSFVLTAGGIITGLRVIWT